SPRLASGCALLDQALDGGLPYGAVTEWGLPPGGGGRRVLVEFMARATSDTPPAGGKPLWCLWARSASSDLQIYPPSWSALGVNLSRIRFTYCRHAVEDLKPLLVDPFFTAVVLDAPERL